MVALSDFFGFTSKKRQVSKFSNSREAYKFAQAVYKETKGATPELRELMREYREKRRNGSVKVRGDVRTPEKR